jgi:hypothetical protein
MRGDYGKKLGNRQRRAIERKQLELSLVRGIVNDLEMI